jgi:hypothetical protein
MIRVGGKVMIRVGGKVMIRGLGYIWVGGLGLELGLGLVVLIRIRVAITFFKEFIWMTSRAYFFIEAPYVDITCAQGIAYFNECISIFHYPFGIQHVIYVVRYTISICVTFG